MKIKCAPEGRKGIYIPDRKSLKAFIKSKKMKEIHCFFPGNGFMLGTDWSPKEVLKEIDAAVRLGLTLKESESENIGHMLALICDVDGRERLRIYDIGKIVEDDLEVTTI